MSWKNRILIFTLQKFLVGKNFQIDLSVTLEKKAWWRFLSYLNYSVTFTFLSKHFSKISSRPNKNFWKIPKYEGILILPPHFVISLSRIKTEENSQIYFIEDNLIKNYTMWILQALALIACVSTCTILCFSKNCSKSIITSWFLSKCLV